MTLQPNATQIMKLRAHLDPLRSGTPLVSSSELDTLDADWTRWRGEWIHRRKVFYKYVAPSSFLGGESQIDDRRVFFVFVFFFVIAYIASGRLWRIRFPRMMLNSLRMILGSNMIRLNMSSWSADRYVAFLLVKGAEQQKVEECIMALRL